MLSDSSNIRIALAVLVSILIHAAFLSLNYGEDNAPVAGSIHKKVTVRLVHRKVPVKPVVTPVHISEKKIEKVTPLQIPEPVEVVVREIPPVFLPEVPAVPEPVIEDILPEVVNSGEVEAASSPEVILATPLYRENPPPDYPSRARRRHLQGTVVLEVSVSRDGKVKQLEISESSGYKILDRAALKAVKNWIFEPGTRGGKRIAMKVLVPLRFRLK